MPHLSSDAADASAKINLGLRILRCRSDGYHDVETGFVRVNWCDRITVGAANSITMTCSDPTLPTDQRNLCIKAAQLLQHRCHVKSGAHIHLEKHIPYSAGLGGGSSDAAATIRLLARIWSISITESDVLEMAAELGSDVAFFISRKYAAIGRGRGGVLTPISLPEEMESLWLGIVSPDVHISTKDAYAEVCPGVPSNYNLQEILTRSDIMSWRTDLINDFEPSIFGRYPKLKIIRDSLYKGGALYAALTGSGSSVFGFFETEQRVIRALNTTGLRTWHGRFRSKIE